jgi:hypothetical protein
MGLRGSLRPLLGEVRSSEYFSDSEKKIKTKNKN